MSPATPQWTHHISGESPCCQLNTQAPKDPRPLYTFTMETGIPSTNAFPLHSSGKENYMLCLPLAPERVRERSSGLIPTLHGKFHSRMHSGQWDILHRSTVKLTAGLHQRLAMMTRYSYCWAVAHLGGVLIHLGVILMTRSHTFFAFPLAEQSPALWHLNLVDILEIENVCMSKYPITGTQVLLSIHLYSRDG